MSQSLNQFLFVSTSSLSLKTSIQQHSLGINLELATFLFTHQEPGPAGPPDSLGKASKPGDSGNASLLCLHHTTAPPIALCAHSRKKPKTCNTTLPGSPCPGMVRGRPGGPRAAQPPPMGIGGYTPASCPEGGMTRRGLFCPVAHRSNWPDHTPFAGCLPCPVSLPSSRCFLDHLSHRLGFQSLPGICLGINTM